ncbi:MAG: ComF family protein [Tropheryma whipplei]|uniref:ComF operon protein 3 n=2 Tax=Tropheryma whipplei TaxID=2039 RepID=Q83N30_TROWT|nr:ComF family protein [Tropheryma whipplei]AAO44226.1 comF operon protein 3 [Tropheryma whipplei str. Twist]MCO8182878.1 ComF family protein [Tropheryma whipplei]
MGKKEGYDHSGQIVNRLGMLTREMSNLFYPTSCPCCGMQDTTLCDLCFARLAERPYRESLAGLDVISCCDYTPAARAFITAYKVMKRMTLAKFMGLIIANQLNVFSSEYGNYSVITMPSTRLSWRSRGFHPVDHALKTIGVEPVDLLCFRKQPKDQAFLDRRERMANMFGTLQVKKISTYSKNLLFVDDVMTSAATLLEVHRAVSLTGKTLIGAVVLFRTRAKYPLGYNVRNKRSDSQSLKCTNHFIPTFSITR